jgi:hypothetical protein
MYLYRIIQTTLTYTHTDQGKFTNDFIKHKIFVEETKTQVLTFLKVLKFYQNTRIRFGIYSNKIDCGPHQARCDCNRTSCGCIVVLLIGAAAPECELNGDLGK